MLRNPKVHIKNGVENKGKTIQSHLSKCSYSAGGMVNFLIQMNGKSKTLLILSKKSSSSSSFSYLICFITSIFS